MSGAFDIATGVGFTTYGLDPDGQCLWVAARDGHRVWFSAPRDADLTWLGLAASVLLRQPVGGNGADLLNSAQWLSEVTP